MPMQQNDHGELAEQELARADEWANRDNVDRETRAHMVDYFLRVAAIHATLAVAQELEGFRLNGLPVEQVGAG